MPLERGGCDEDIARVFFGMKLVERSIYPYWRVAFFVFVLRLIFGMMGFGEGGGA